MTNFDLDDVVLGEKSPKKLIVFFHGYGGDAPSFEPLGRMFINAIPNVAVRIPNGFEDIELGGSGRQWFSLEGWGGDAWRGRLIAIAPKINIYLDNLLLHYKLTNDDLILSGFSQGAMIALHCGIERDVQAVLSFSGALVYGGILGNKTKIPQVLLIHGDADAVISVAAAYEAFDAFKARGFVANLSIIPRLEHVIDNRSASVGVEFLRAAID